MLGLYFKAKSFGLGFEAHRKFSAEDNKPLYMPRNDMVTGRHQ